MTKKEIAIEILIEANDEEYPEDEKKALLLAASVLLAKNTIEGEELDLPKIMLAVAEEIINRKLKEIEEEENQSEHRYN